MPGSNIYCYVHIARGMAYFTIKWAICFILYVKQCMLYRSKSHNVVMQYTNQLKSVAKFIRKKAQNNLRLGKQALPSKKQWLSKIKKYVKVNFHYLYTWGRLPFSKILRLSSICQIQVVFHLPKNWGQLPTPVSLLGHHSLRNVGI